MISRWLALLSVLCTATIVTADNGDLVRIGDLWRYHKSPSRAARPDTNWHKRDFDDSRWRFATSGFEIADEEEGMHGRGGPGYMFLRRAFQVKDPASIRSLILRVEHEQGYVAYLNGVEIARNHSRGIQYPTPAEKAAGMEDPVLTVGVHDLDRSLLAAGENVLAIEGIYTGQSMSTLSLAATVTANFPRGPFIQNTTPTSVQIIWRTATPGSSFVRYGLSPAVSMVVTNEQLVTDHVVTLTSLTPDTKYFYQVGSATNAADEPLCSAVEWFRTFKTSGRITFGALGDTGDGSSFQRSVATVLRSFNPDLVIHHGDVIYGGFTDATVDTRVFNIYTQMKNTPFFFSAGNHDLNCCGGPPDNELTNFQSAFYLPTNSMEGTELYYSFDHGDAHFVALYNPWFTSYVFTNGTAQYDWLTNDLANSQKKWKFLFFHNPIAHSGNPHSAADRDANGVLDQTQLMHLLEPVANTYGVQLIFTGHDHTFEKLAPTNGLHTVVSGGGGYSGLYQLLMRHIATAQHRPIHHCLKVTVDGDVLTAQALSTAGVYVDGFVINRALPQDRIYSSTWNTPTLETTAPNADGNIPGQTFDLIGAPILPRHGRFSNLGEFYVNNDSTNLYLGFRNAMFYRDNNIFLFVESPHVGGPVEMRGLGNGVIDPTVQGADGLDCLENLSFTNFSPLIACILGDEFGDRTTNSFTRTNLALNIGQGVFRLDTDLTSVTNARLQQFNRSPEGTATIANDNSADFIEVSIPFSALGDVRPGDIVKVAAVVGGPGFDAKMQTRQLDTAALGISLSGSGQDPVMLGAVSVRLAFPPNFDNDGDGLLDNWELAYGLDPENADGDFGAEGDPDGDGHTNSQEQIAGTDPCDANSVLRLSLTPLDSTFYRVSWRAVPGKRYQLEYAEDQITSFVDFIGDDWPRTASSSEEVFEDDVSMDPPSLMRAYRVRLVEP